MDIFRNPTKSLPKEPGDQTVRVPMKQNEIGGRTDHIPPPPPADKKPIFPTSQSGIVDARNRRKRTRREKPCRRLGAASTRQSQDAHAGAGDPEGTQPGL